MKHTHERYARAVRSDNLRHTDRHEVTDVDVVGAVGLVGNQHALGAALVRFDAGDGKAGAMAASALATKVIGYAWHRRRRRIDQAQAVDLAMLVLNWRRNGRCKHCDGAGYLKINGAPTLSATECPECTGRGRVSLTRLAGALEDEAHWITTEIDRLIADMTREAGFRLRP